MAARELPRPGCRASSTLRGYRSDRTEFVIWCRDNHHIALPDTDIAEMTKWKTRDDEPSLSGIRDRVLLLVGFVSALRASQLAALEVDQIKPHERGLVIELTHSKTNQTGDL